MLINDSSKVIYFDFDGPRIDNDEFREFLKTIPDSFREDIKYFLLKIDGKFFYYKHVSDMEMINELIGTYYCKLVGLDVVDYKIGIRNGEYYALSQIFYQKGFSYTGAFNYYLTSPNQELTTTQSTFSKFYLNQTTVLERVKNPKMISNILKLTSVDLKMGQRDRHDRNLRLRKKNGVLDLEKIFDFGESYKKRYNKDDKLFYDNPFLILRKNTISLMSFAHKYPEISNSAAILCDAPIYDVLKEIEKENNINFEDNIISYYSKKDTEFTNILRKLR